jgi:triosephosphate isomerase (TIM)
MTKILVVANWKMNPSLLREAKKLLEAIKKAARKAKGVSVVVAPPAVFVRTLSKGERSIAFAVQRASGEDGGAYTGEISMKQARDAGASFAIVGHSETRFVGETNDNIRKQVAATLAARMTPILCVGEKERSVSGDHFNVVAEQLRVGLTDVSATKLARVIIAYEPVWAIGGEQTMSPRDMHEMAIFIRKTMVESHGDAGHKVKILYGGSANEENAAPMIEEGDVSGLLVGHVSVDAPRFAALLSSL